MVNECEVLKLGLAVGGGVIVADTVRDDDG